MHQIKDDERLNFMNIFEENDEPDSKFPWLYAKKDDKEEKESPKHSKKKRLSNTQRR